MIELKIRRGSMYHLWYDNAGRTVSHPLSAGTTRIGRGDGNDIVIRIDSVSRAHSEILVGPDSVMVSDLGSTHGTFVNDALITGPTPLNLGDTIRVGRCRLVFRERPPGENEVLEPAQAITAAGLQAGDSVRSIDRLSIGNAATDAIQSPQLTHALLMAVTEAGQILAAPRPLNEVFDRVLDLVAQVIPARRILLLTIDSPGAEPVIRSSRSTARAEGQPLVLSRTIINSVSEQRESLLLNDAANDPRFNTSESIVAQSLRSAMVAPLIDDADLMGLLYVDHDDRLCRYSRDQLKAFTLLANLIAIKITNTRLLESERAMFRMEEELASAARVQQSMLPASIPEVTGYSIAAHQVPCLQVGGDLYDLARLDDGRIVFALGDISGKGMSAALLMSNVMACLRVLYQECLEPGCLADRLHRELLESTEVGYFATLFLGILDPTTHRIEYVNAGHNPPMLMAGDAPPLLLEATGPPLGILEGASYRTMSVDFPDGALLCLFSDGIPEACVLQDFYGEDRFLESIQRHRELPVDGTKRGILDDLDAYLGDTPPADDITLLLLRRGMPAGARSA